MQSKHFFHIQTFGCQMNASDSAWLARSLQARGFLESAFEDADLYILNTCSVRDKPEQKVYSELGRIASYCKMNNRRGVTVCVGGCVAQQVGSKLTRRFPQVRLLFGTDGIANAPEAISRLMDEPDLRLSLLDFAEHYEERADIWRETGTESAEARIPPAAFVNIMQGCDNFCTYCIVPYVRGRQKSRLPSAVLEECRTLVKGGAREITLLGQNVNSYGQDRSVDGFSFADLLRQVADIPGLERLRFVTSHPKDIAPEVIESFAKLKILCPRLHLPMQSGSDKILKAMNRRYDTAHYLDIVSRLKQARPDILFTTDIIVGFPGETEEDFQATMAMMREVGFVSSFSFVYSDRPHARAAFLPNKVERAVALERLSRLQDWQNRVSNNILTSMKGEVCVILLEGKSRLENLLPDTPELKSELTRTECVESCKMSPPLRSGTVAWQGKTPHGFIVNVELDERYACLKNGWLGALLPVSIEAASRHSLKGVQVGAPW